MRFILRRIGKRMERKFRGAGKPSSRDSARETTVIDESSSEVSDKDEGEYIDYEEID